MLHRKGGGAAYGLRSQARVSGRLSDGTAFDL